MDRLVFYMKLLSMYIHVNYRYLFMIFIMSICMMMTMVMVIMTQYFNPLSMIILSLFLGLVYSLY